MVDNTGKVTVQLAWLHEAQDCWVKTMQVDPGTRVSEVIQRAKLSEQAHDLPCEPLAVGIYGTIVRLDTVVKEGDRIEIYAPLKVTPEMARKQRLSD